MSENVKSILPHMPEQIRLVVFDLDGTLADTFEDIAAATNHVLTSFDCPTLDVATIKTYVGCGARHLLARALGPERETFADAAVVLWREFYERHPTDHATLYPGVVDLLEWLRDHDVRTAIVSNKVDALTQTVATTMGLAERVDFVCGEADEFPRKPDPAILDHIREMFGVRREHTLVVGDNTPDLDLARNGGAAFCGVLTGQIARDQFRAQGAEWLVDTMDVLHEQLKASGACQR